jgi:mRNA-degrading endonuclease RelE of RelBE toxin-antitoxin system
MARSTREKAPVAYEIEFATVTKAHLSYLTASERARVIHEIVGRLADEPLVETRNRKPLRSNPLAPWELRLGALRVFYEVDQSGTAVVRVLAIGKKVRNTLWIGGTKVGL